MSYAFIYLFKYLHPPFNVGSAGQFRDDSLLLIVQHSTFDVLPYEENSKDKEDNLTST